MISFLSFKDQEASYEPCEIEEVNRPLSRPQYRSTSHILTFLAGCLLVLLGGFSYRIFVGTGVERLSVIPSVPFETVIFSSHPEYSTASTTAWDSLTEYFSRYIHIEDPIKYDLQPGVRTEEGKNVYGVSMYHSLHCLKMIHNDYWSLVQSPSHSSDSTPSDEQSHVDAMRPHIGHCFDYIRQSIQCSADMTISWANLTEPERPHIDGWDIPHRQCRDLKSILPGLKAMDAMPKGHDLNDHHRHPIYSG